MGRVILREDVSNGASDKLEVSHLEAEYPESLKSVADLIVNRRWQPAWPAARVAGLELLTAQA